MGDDMKHCLSTHGLSGYAPGSYRDGNAIICGMCGERIENPMPTGTRRIEYSLREALSNWQTFKAYLINEPKAVVPTFPDWIL